MSAEGPSINDVSNWEGERGQKLVKIADIVYGWSLKSCIKDENQQLTVKQLTDNRQKNNWVTKKTRLFKKLFKPKMICSTIRWNFVVNFWRLDNKNVVSDFNLKRPPLFHLTLNWQRKISNVPIACQTSQLQNIKKYDWLIDNQMVEKNLRQQQNKDDDFCVRQVVHTQFFFVQSPARHEIF